jgi:hypothetical protein
MNPTINLTLHAQIEKNAKKNVYCEGACEPGRERISSMFADFLVNFAESPWAALIFSKNHE